MRSGQRPGGVGAKPVAGVAREAFRASLSRPVSSLVGFVVAASVSGFILATVGQTALTEQTVLGRIDDEGTRAVTVVDVEGSAGLMPSVVQHLLALDVVSSALALGPAVDVFLPGLGSAGPRVPSRTYYGSLDNEIDPSLAPLREPAPGEGLVGHEAHRRLGMAQPVGAVMTASGSTTPVIGVFDPPEHLAFLATGVLVRGGGLTATAAPATTVAVRSLHIITTSPENVAVLAGILPGLLGAENLSSLRIETSEQLARVRDVLAGDLSRFGRQLVAIVLAVGLVLTGLNSYATVTSQKRDLGRRRVLGASRSMIAALVSLQSLLPAVVGSALGAALGAALVATWLGSWPPWSFLAGTVVLTALVSGLAGLPPAVLAAWRDPVRVVRQP